jgi:hypothetical protein
MRCHLQARSVAPDPAEFIPVLGLLDRPPPRELDAFNRRAQDAGQPWRLAEVEPRGWALVDLPGVELLDLRAAVGGFDAVARAAAWLKANGRI